MQNNRVLYYTKLFFTKHVRFLYYSTADPTKVLRSKNRIERSISDPPPSRDRNHTPIGQVTRDHDIFTVTNSTP